MDFLDISWAYFQADAIREVDVELPLEDYEERMCGNLKESLHWTGGAAQNWGEEYSRFMIESGVKRGNLHPACSGAPTDKSAV